MTVSRLLDVVDAFESVQSTLNAFYHPTAKCDYKPESSRLATTRCGSSRLDTTRYSSRVSSRLVSYAEEESEDEEEDISDEFPSPRLPNPRVPTLDLSRLRPAETNRMVTRDHRLVSRAVEALQLLAEDLTDQTDHLTMSCQYLLTEKTRVETLLMHTRAKLDSAIAENDSLVQQMIEAEPQRRASWCGEVSSTRAVENGTQTTPVRQQSVPTDCHGPSRLRKRRWQAADRISIEPLRPTKMARPNTNVIRIRTGVRPSLPPGFVPKMPPPVTPPPPRRTVALCLRSVCNFMFGRRHATS